MAVSTSYKSGDDSKTNSDSSNKNVLPIGWKPINNGQTLQQPMLHVKDSFIKKAKQVLGHEYPGYEPTDIGIQLFYGGFEHLIGLVKLSKPNTLGGYYASIRVSLNITLSPPGPNSIPYILTGFLIDSKQDLNFVNEGQYGDMFIHDKKWQHVEGGDTLKLLKDSMEQVKSSFKQKIKEDFDLTIDEYNPTIQGLYYFLINEQYMIGLVKISSKGIFGNYYASIRASQSTIIPIEPSWYLQGFLIDSKPLLHFVNSGQFGFIIIQDILPPIGTGNDKLNKILKKQENNNTLFNKISFASTEFVQDLLDIDQVKDSIKKKCGINYQLSKYQVVSAAKQFAGYFVGGFPVMVYYGRISIGINPWTQFESFINVSVTNTVFDGKQSITVTNANTFPL